MWTAFLCCAADLLLRDSHAVNQHVCLCHLDVLFDIKQNKGVCALWAAAVQTWKWAKSVISSVKDLKCPVHVLYTMLCDFKDVERCNCNQLETIKTIKLSRWKRPSSYYTKPLHSVKFQYAHHATNLHRNVMLQIHPDKCHTINVL